MFLILSRSSGYFLKGIFKALNAGQREESYEDHEGRPVEAKYGPLRAIF